MRLVNCLRIGSFVNRWYLCSNWLCSLRYEWPARITLDEMALARDAVVILSGRLLCVAASQQRVVKLVGGDTLGPPLLPAFLICYDFNQIWKFVMRIKVNVKCFSWAPLPYQPRRSRVSLMRGWESHFFPLRERDWDWDWGLSAHTGNDTN